MTMIKNYHQEELKFNGPLMRGNKGEDVIRVQSWLNLWKWLLSDWNYQLLRDGDFGPATQGTLTEWQKRMGCTDNLGRLDQATWEALTKPMYTAFLVTEESMSNERDLILEYLDQHLLSCPKELGSNEGPWVRAYMGGNDGKQWAWCMGFVQTIIDQAYSTVGRKFTDIMPKTYSCDVLGEHGLDNGALIRNADLRKASNIDELVKPGDIFLIVKSEHDWVHTGIITKVDGTAIHTVEGNTNDEGSREGYEVCRRVRDIGSSNIDVFVIS